ncbi:hypothetical protein ACS0TY_014331 [Phlomoides rotata]
MREIEGIDHGAHEYLRAIDASKWTFSHDGGHRYGVVMTNISEAINGVKGTRRLPITAITNNKSNNLCGGNVALSHIQSFIIRTRVRLRVVEVERTTEYTLTYSLSFFEPLPDIEYWDKPNFQLRHNPDRRIRHRGRDMTTRIHNEMDWAQTRARQQYQAQDRARPSTGGSASRH